MGCGVPKLVRFYFEKIIFKWNEETFCYWWFSNEKKRLFSGESKTDWILIIIAFECDFKITKSINASLTSQRRSLKILYLPPYDDKTNAKLTHQKPRNVKIPVRMSLLIIRVAVNIYLFTCANNVPCTYDLLDKDRSKERCWISIIQIINPRIKITHQMWVRVEHLKPSSYHSFLLETVSLNFLRNAK